MAEAAAIQFNVDAALAKLGELVAKHGPDAVNLAAQVVQITAVQTLVSGAAGAAIAVGVGSYVARHCSAVAKASDGHLDIFDTNPLIVIPGVILSFIATPVALGNLLDVWAWVALFEPKLALAHEIFAKLTAA